jgi:hypothetical protein
MNTADIIILVLLILWGGVAIRSIFRRKKSGWCHGCDGNCMSQSCPNSTIKKETKFIRNDKDKNGI